ncbi:homoserine dehydrogenase [Verrucomicrobia bacterium]|nr:homoserine dehydrogenase [Verrucomicrobiota bacterium]
MRTVNIGIIGGGTVGGGVVRALRRNGVLMASRLGVHLRVARIAVRSRRKKRAVKLPAALLTTDWREIVEDPKIDLVVELMGGTTTAKDVVLAALSGGKPVVTANKALLAFHGEKLFAASEKSGANLYYEASVAGGIPIIKLLREGLIGNHVTELYGILNGTCNFILAQMQENGVDFEEAVAEAQTQGFAEADPSMDVDGHDAAHKVGILASLAHGFWVKPKRVFTEGIRHVTPQDLAFADQLGYRIKLLGTVKATKDTPVQVTMYPALVPKSHVLASVGGVYNAIYLKGDVLGDTLYYGQGAGQDATASAVLGDIADAALDLKHDSPERVRAFTPHEANGEIGAIDDVVNSYYLRLNVLDRPGVLNQVASTLAKAKISIASVLQPEGQEGKNVLLALMLHAAPEASMSKALKVIAKLASVKKPTMIRVENFD